MKNLERFAKPVLRIALSLVFVSFGIMQLGNSLEWSGFVPDFALSLGFQAITLVKINAILELSFGVLMLLGLYTRIVALILSLHLFVIASSLGFNDLAVRDFGLAFATLAVFLNGPDDFCLDKKFNKPLTSNP